MYEKFRWGFVYLNTTRNMPLEESHYLVSQAVDMYLEKEKKRNLQRDMYEGVIFNTGQSGILGSFSGHKFAAELETDKGKVNLEFIVTEKIDASLN